MFPMYGEKCLSRKTVPPWWQTFRWWRRGWNGGAEVAETTVKRLPRCDFRLTGKAMGQVYQCSRGICREINVFPRLEITCFTICIHWWPVYWLSFVHGLSIALGRSLISSAIYYWVLHVPQYSFSCTAMHGWFLLPHFCFFFSLVLSPSSLVHVSLLYFRTGLSNISV
jgi:hypothetical protein